MRILHTSDWHLGKRLASVSRLEEQAMVMEEICLIAEKEEVDAVLLAGDIFDSYNPPTEAVDLFYKTLKRLANDGQRAVVAIAGNHDSPASIEAPDPLARACGILFAGYPNSRIAPFILDTGLEVTRSDAGFVELRLPKHSYPLRLLLTPYANEQRLKKFLGVEDAEEALRNVLATQWQGLADSYCDDEGVNILMAHLLFMKKGESPPEEPDAERPILHLGGAQEIFTENIPSQVQYTALGHLHRKQSVGAEHSPPVVYSSSPLCYSFSEAGQQKYVVIIEAEPGRRVNVKSLELSEGKPLFRKRFEQTDEAVAWLMEHQNALVELTMVTDEFLTSQARKKLYAAHNGIIALIPEVKNKRLLHQDSGKQIDLSQDLEALFIQYFEHKHGQPPNAELMTLLKEVIAENKDA